MELISSKNLILYGPPGTGKTYETIRIALQICGQWRDEYTHNRSEAVSVFKNLQDNGQIEFVTFHQSFSYEEFVEGIQAIVPAGGGDVSYEVKDGVFKKICKASEKNSPTFQVGEVVGSYEIREINGNNLNLISVRNGEGEGRLVPIPFDLIQEMAERIRNGQCKIEDIGTKDAEVKKRTSVRYDKFILGYGAQLRPLVRSYLEKIETNTPKNYVIIIDEINRANISKVFGELIALIEEDKRKGNENELQVRLPYSQQLFSVPKNLYIIGTMNTADRSIALMDVALRRRFQFVELMPNPELLTSIPTGNVEQIDLSQLLITLNKRITALVGRDYSLGHVFFMNVHNVNELVNAFRNKIIPLLQEYFYNDWEKIALVFGDNQKHDNNLRLIQVDPEYDLSQLFGDYDLLDPDTKNYVINPQFGSNEEQDFKIIKSIYTS
ncbi:MAG: McrB family protein [Neobacillus sp.]